MALSYNLCLTFQYNTWVKLFFFPYSKYGFFGLLKINSRVFTGKPFYTLSPKLSKSLSQSLGKEHLEKSCFSHNKFPKSWLFLPFSLNRYWKTSCRKGMIVGDILLDARFSKTTACKASTPEVTNSSEGF